MVDDEFIKITVYPEGNKSPAHRWHLQTVPKLDVLSRTSRAGPDMNVMMIMYDSVSDANFFRQMPLSLKFLQEDMGAVIMKGK